ncbi:hypothetical protein L7F22_053348 [Adiantum nelumboides]|nr:hypothetical protein [Adiantum nelumboides]
MQSAALLSKLIVRGLYPGEEPWKQFPLHGLSRCVPSSECMDAAGVTAFLRSISLEAVGLGVQLAAGAHEILLQTESALGSAGLISLLEKGQVRTKAGQPGDMREGLLQAYESLSQGLERTASSLIRHPLKAYQKEGPSMAVASALRAAPSAAVLPAVAAAGALHRALLGLRSSLDPERQRESVEKHSEPPP